MFWGWYCYSCQEEWDANYTNQELWDIWRYQQYVFGIRNKAVVTRRAILVSRTGSKNLSMCRVMSTDIFTEMIAAYSCNLHYNSDRRSSSKTDTITFRLHKCSVGLAIFSENTQPKNKLSRYHKHGMKAVIRLKTK